MAENAAEKTSTWASLAELISRQADEYGMFLDMLEEKEKALITGDPKKIRVMLNKENEFVKKLEKLEDLRIETAAGLHPSGPAATLRELLEAAPQEEAAELDAAAIRLIEKLNAVALKNKTNSELIASAMEFTNYMINLLSSSAMPEESTYGYTGKIKQADPAVKNLLNRHV